MSMKTKVLAALAAAAGITGIAHAIPTADYVKAAGAGDLYETKASQLVLGSTKDAHVKMVAKMMIADHAKSTAMVKKAAMSSGLHPAPPMLEPKQKAMIAELTAAKGTDRDTAYLKQQKAVHEEALALHSGYAADGSNPALRDAAKKIAPVVQHHIAMLNGSK